MIQANPLFNDAIKKWSPYWDTFFPDEQSKQDFHKFGYYSAPLIVEGKKIPKTRIISLNTVYCYVQNFENLVQFEDPNNML